MSWVLVDIFNWKSGLYFEILILWPYYGMLPAFWLKEGLNIVINNDIEIWTTIFIFELVWLKPQHIYLTSRLCKTNQTDGKFLDFMLFLSETEDQFSIYK